MAAVVCQFVCQFLIDLQVEPPKMVKLPLMYKALIDHRCDKEVKQVHDNGVTQYFSCTS